jgi:hypothetical protein
MMGESCTLEDFANIRGISISVATALSIPIAPIAASNSEVRKWKENKDKKNEDNAPTAAAPENFQPRECEFSRRYDARNKHRLGNIMIREYDTSAKVLCKTSTLPL